MALIRIGRAFSVGAGGPMRRSSARRRSSSSRGRTLMELAARPWLESGRLLTLGEPQQRRAFLLLTHAERHRSQAAKSFVDTLP